MEEEKKIKNVNVQAEIGKASNLAKYNLEGVDYRLCYNVKEERLGILVNSVNGKKELVDKFAEDFNFYVKYLN